MTGSTMVYNPFNSGMAMVPVFGHSQRPSGKRQRTGFAYSSSGTKLTTKRKTKKKQWKSFAQRVKNVAPAKHLSGTTNVVVTNGNIFTCGLTNQIGAGTGNAQRIGDSIQLEALKIEGLFQAATDADAYKFRLIIGYSGEEYGVTTLTTGNLTSTELFLPNTDTTMVNAIVNPKTFTVLYDEVYDLNSQVSGDSTLQSLRATIPLKKNFPYQSAGSVYGKTQNLYMVVTSYAVSAVGGASIGSALIAYDLIFKNL